MHGYSTNAAIGSSDQKDQSVLYDLLQQRNAEQKKTEREKAQDIYEFGALGAVFSWATLEAANDPIYDETLENDRA